MTPPPQNTLRLRLSQGSVAMLFRCGGIFNSYFIQPARQLQSPLSDLKTNDKAEYLVKISRACFERGLISQIRPFLQFFFTEIQK